MARGPNTGPQVAVALYPVFPEAGCRDCDNNCGDCDRDYRSTNDRSWLSFFLSGFISC